MQGAKKFPSLKLAEVTWVDACVRGGWDLLDEYERAAHTSVCKTAGYILKRTRNEIVLIQSMSDKRHVSDSMTIPAKCIHKVRLLTPGGRR